MSNPFADPSHSQGMDSVRLPQASVSRAPLISRLDQNPFADPAVQSSLHSTQQEASYGHYAGNDDTPTASKVSLPDSIAPPAQGDMSSRFDDLAKREQALAAREAQLNAKAEHIRKVSDALQRRRSTEGRHVDRDAPLSRALLDYSTVATTGHQDLGPSSSTISTRCAFAVSFSSRSPKAKPPLRSRSQEIPEAHKSTVLTLYRLWMFLILVLIVNFVADVLLLVSGGKFRARILRGEGKALMYVCIRL